MKTVDGALRSAFETITLPLDKLPDRAALEQMRDKGNRYQASLARRMLARLDAGQDIPRDYPYPVQAVQLGDGPTLVTLGGEVVVDYALRLKRELGPQRTWMMAYANDVMAYIPSVRVLEEGGYEGETSMIVYGLPGKWSPKIEEMIVASVHRLVGKVRPSGAR
jgi:neutral ceramidase